MNKFRPGDRVKLRSGGAVMLVAGLCMNGEQEPIFTGEVRCQWHDLHYQPQTEYYYAGLLVRADDNQES